MQIDKDVQKVLNQYNEANDYYRERNKWESLNLDKITDKEAKEVAQYLNDFVTDKQNKYYYIDKVETILNKYNKNDSHITRKKSPTQEQFSSILDEGFVSPALENQIRSILEDIWTNHLTYKDSITTVMQKAYNVCKQAKFHIDDEDLRLIIAEAVVEDVSKEYFKQNPEADYIPEDYVDDLLREAENFTGTKLSSRFYESEDVKIDVENPGVLEVPEDKKFWELPLSHFEKLVDKKGYAKVIRALTNLEVWNKNTNPDISKKASDIADKLKAKHTD